MLSVDKDGKADPILAISLLAKQFFCSRDVLNPGSGGRGFQNDIKCVSSIHLTHTNKRQFRGIADDTQSPRNSPQALQTGPAARGYPVILDGALSARAQPLSASGVNGGFTVAPHHGYWVEEE